MRILVSISICASFLLANTTVSYNKGWNLITSPVASKSVNSSAFSDPKLEAKWSYDSQKQSWVSDFSSIQPNLGYWFKFSDNVSIEIQDSSMSDSQGSDLQTTLSGIVENEWYLLGTTSDLSVDAIKASGVTNVFSYSNETNSWSTSGAIKSGSGFWVYKDTASNSSSTGSTTNNGKKQLALYLLGSDLEGNVEKNGGRPSNMGTNDLNELVDGYKNLTQAQKDSLEIIVIFGGAKRDNWYGYRVANIEQIVKDSEDKEFGNSGDYLKEDKTADMGKQETLEMFLNDYVNKSGQKYVSRFMVFWDHGGSYGGYGPDENTQSAFSLPQLDASLKNTGSKFDMIGYDACLMASLETAKYMKPYAKYLLGSEDLEPGHGWNWNHVITNYVSKDLVGFGKAAIDSFTNNDNHPMVQAGKTLSLVDLEKFDFVTSALDTFAQKLIENFEDVENVRRGVFSAIGDARAYGKSKDQAGISMDLKNFAQITKEKSNNQDVKSSADSLISALDGYILYAKEDGTRPNSLGVTVAPISKTLTVAQNHQIELSTNWTALGQKYITTTQSDTTPPQVSVSNSDAQFSSVEPKSLAPNGYTSDFTNYEKGTLFSVVDDNLISSNSVYTVKDANGSILALGEIEAVETKDGKYFVPEWNGKWFTLTNGSKSVQIPLKFAGAEDDNEMIFEGEVTFNDEDGVIEIVYNPTKKSFTHAIKLYDIDKEGDVIFSKDYQELTKNDKIEFWVKKLKDTNGTLEFKEWVKYSDLTVGDGAVNFSFESISGAYTQNGKGNILADDDME